LTAAHQDNSAEHAATNFSCRPSTFPSLAYPALVCSFFVIFATMRKFACAIHFDQSTTNRELGLAGMHGQSFVCDGSNLDDQLVVQASTMREVLFSHQLDPKHLID
jgi:hypothetical protein